MTPNMYPNIRKTKNRLFLEILIETIYFEKLKFITMHTFGNKPDFIILFIFFNLLFGVNSLRITKNV